MAIVNITAIVQVPLANDQVQPFTVGIVLGAGSTARHVSSQSAAAYFRGELSHCSEPETCVNLDTGVEERFLSSDDIAEPGSLRATGPPVMVLLLIPSPRPQGLRCSSHQWDPFH